MSNNENSNDKTSLIENLNNNHGAYTLLFAIFAPVMSIILTLMLYSYYHGYYSFFHVSDVRVDIGNKSSIYSLVFMLFCSLAFLVLNVIPIIAMKYKKGKGLVFSCIFGFVLYIITAVVLYFFNGQVIGNVPAISLCAWIISYGMGFAYGVSDFIIEWRYERKNKKLSKQGKENRNIDNQNKTDTKMITTIMVIFVVVCVIFETIACYSVGKSIADDQTVFKILAYNGEPMAVLCESDETFVISKVDIDTDKNTATIFADEQIIINNNDIQYEIINFDDVQIEKSFNSLI